MAVVWAAGWPGAGAEAYWPWPEIVAAVQDDDEGWPAPGTEADSERFGRFRPVTRLLQPRAASEGGDLDVEPVALEDALAHGDIERHERERFGHRFADTQLVLRKSLLTGKQREARRRNNRTQSPVCHHGSAPASGLFSESSAAARRH